MLNTCSSVCAVSFIAVMAIAGSAPHGGGARAQGGKVDFLDELMRRQNNRAKFVDFDDPHRAACPRFTSLIYASGEKFEIVMPNIAFAGFSMRGGLGGSDDGPNAEEFEFLTDRCRYIVTVKKFVITGDAEAEDPLHRGPSPAPPQARQPARPPTLEGPVGTEGNKAVITDDPARSGLMQIHVWFVSPTPNTQFTGLLYFSPKTMTVFLANAPKELELESRKNPASRSYELDIKSLDSRIRLSVKKEIYVNDSWIRAFNE
jgi:hypothetical protein